MTFDETIVTHKRITFILHLSSNSGIFVIINHYDIVKSVSRYYMSRPAIPKNFFFSAVDVDSDGAISAPEMAMSPTFTNSYLLQRGM